MNVVLFENIGKFLLRPSDLNKTTFLDQNNTVCLTDYAYLVDKSKINSPLLYKPFSYLLALLLAKLLAGN